MRTFLRSALVAGLAAGLSLVAGTADATPAGPGITARIISQSTVGDTDYILREITIPPGQSTGWHFHDGTLYGYVQKGTLSHFDSTCAADGVYHAGSALREPSGAGHVHIGRNLGRQDVVLDVLYVLPHGAPFSEDAPNPGCDFQ
ncbi:cupin domain-containing protein (plasmid) [Streptomyces sp. NBC_01707]|uniref:cupin domain-containing protein n=1 Tax=unclassified Streptomyces TaxID=2593676 RepID=UPI0029AC6074|nr:MULTISPECIES: cupin domain-containing protein [unclassified Streptomyces]MDX3771184.1 cupin domain-containing protein [Streptomyces sp. AK08-01B]MDX3820776.1 cupin domain-containing protein [Streptomyces sp. AK08-01A]